MARVCGGLENGAFDEQARIWSRQSFLLRMPPAFSCGFDSERCLEWRGGVFAIVAISLGLFG
jgi:hypothetical protein